MAITVTVNGGSPITISQQSVSPVNVKVVGATGPAGATGATGPTGPAGADGADGKTYTISCVDGDNSDEEKIRLTDNDGTTDDVVLEAGTGMSIARSGDKITLTNTVTDTNTQLTTEQVQDIVGAMFSSNTETRISATYEDSDGTIDLVVDDMNSTARSLTIACSDETSDLTTGTAKATFRMPQAATITAVRASVTTAPAGSALTVDINESGSTILSTKLTIDAGEKTSTTAATAAVISDASIADDAEMTIDIDAIGSSTAGAGLKVTIYYNPA